MRTLLKPKKTKMVSSEEIYEFALNGEKVEIILNVVFLGATIEVCGSCKGEIF